jgi:hypothetical protein
MSSSADRIQDTEMREALLRSGYLLESRIETVLQARGYHLEMSAPVPDPKTGTSREMDAYAMKAIDVRFRGDTEQFVCAVLLIECVNNSQPIAFITKESQHGPIDCNFIKVAGMPPELSINGKWASIAEALGLSEYHHYFQGRLATQWCSFAAKDIRNTKKWIALHDEVHFNDLSKLSTAVEYFADKCNQRWNMMCQSALHLQFYYPILVLQGELTEVRPKNTALTLAQVDHINFRRSIVVGDDEKRYHIDVVTEGYLPRLLELIEKELEEIATRLKTNEGCVRNSIKAIGSLTCG